MHFSPFLTCTEFQTAFLLLSFAAWPLLLNLLLRPLFKSSAVSNLPPCPTLLLPIYLNISTYCLGVYRIPPSLTLQKKKKSHAVLLLIIYLCLPFPLVYLIHISLGSTSQLLLARSWKLYC